MIDETINKLNAVGLKDIVVSLETQFFDSDSGQKAYEILHADRWEVVHIKRDPSTGRVIQSNDDESLVHFNDGDRCAVATCYLRRSQYD